MSHFQDFYPQTNYPEHSSDWNLDEKIPGLGKVSNKNTKKILGVSPKTTKEQLKLK
jgi:hypothetical protein